MILRTTQPPKPYNIFIFGRPRGPHSGVSRLRRLRPESAELVLPHGERRARRPPGDRGRSSAPKLASSPRQCAVASQTPRTALDLRPSAASGGVVPGASVRAVSSRFSLLNLPTRVELL